MLLLLLALPFLMALALTTMRGASDRALAGVAAVAAGILALRGRRAGESEEASSTEAESGLATD